MNGMRALRLVLGIVLVTLGVYVLVRAFVVRQPLTAAPWLDLVFGAFFLLRGAMNLKAVRRPAAVPPAGPGGTGSGSGDGGGPAGN